MRVVARQGNWLNRFDCYEGMEMNESEREVFDRLDYLSMIVAVNDNFLIDISA